MGLTHGSYSTTVSRRKTATIPPHVSLTRDEHESLRAALAALLAPLDGIDADTWRGLACRALRNLVHADSAVFRIDAPGISVLYSEDYSKKILDTYAGYYSSIDLSQARRAELGLEVWNFETLHGSDMREFRKSEIYRDFLAPNGIHDAIGLSIATNDKAGEATIILYSEKADSPEFGDRGLALLELVLPAFKAGIRELLRHSTHKASGASHHKDATLSDRALKERFKLTVRELEITRRLAQGQSTKEVAHSCGISLHTARRHSENIFLKLGVRNRSQIGPKLRAG